MRILQVCSADGIGGGEVHVADLALGLLERGYDVEMAVRPASKLPDYVARRNHVKAGSLVWHQLPLRNAMDLGSVRGLARILTERSIDVVHAHVARDYPVVALAASPGKRAALVVTRHHYLPLKGNLVYRRLLSKARIIAVSDSVRRTVIESLGCKPSRVHRISNWIDLARHSAPRQRGAERHAYGITRRVAVALVGQITPLKGHEEFIKAAARIVAERADVEFLIVGSDTEPGHHFETRLRREVREFGIEDFVRFQGHVDDLNGLLAAVDAVIVPSWNEAFSLVTAEAMAAGRAVVASRAGALEELVEHDRTGLLVPARDPESLATAIVRLAEDPALVEFLGQNAKVAAERFSRDHSIDSVVNVYKEALADVMLDGSRR